MKICVTSQGKGLESEVDPRFGRAKYFVFVDTETMELEAIENSNTGALGGVGVLSAKTISDKGAEFLLTGNVGPNAFRTLKEMKITVATGFSGTVSDAVEKFKRGEYSPVENPSVQGHFGEEQ